MKSEGAQVLLSFGIAFCIIAGGLLFYLTAGGWTGIAVWGLLVGLGMILGAFRYEAWRSSGGGRGRL